MNSREKGKRGEREFAALLRESGFDARRGQQFSGGAESPDVVSEDLAWLHIEVKHVEQLNVEVACCQAERDSDGKAWIVAHRRNGTPWRITMGFGFFLEFLRRMLPPEGTGVVSSASAVGLPLTARQEINEKKSEGKQTSI